MLVHYVGSGATDLAMLSRSRSRPGHPDCPELSRNLPNRPQNGPETDKITPKFARTDHPQRTIPSKTLEIAPGSLSKKSFFRAARHRSVFPGSGRPMPSAAVRIRTGPNKSERTDLKKAEKT
ncbi:MAG: hypothetical protein OXS30_09190 [Chloroflexota bacterium]|nr:hypothetical protein [Chloroflexota bacterium]